MTSQPLGTNPPIIHTIENPRGQTDAMVVFPPPPLRTNGLNPLNFLDPRSPVHEEYHLEYPLIERTRTRRDNSGSYSTDTGTLVEDDRRDDSNPKMRRAGNGPMYPESRRPHNPERTQKTKE